MRRVYRWSWARVLSLAALVVWAGCDVPKDAELDAYLMVARSAAQPDSPDQGVEITLQQRGGRYLQIRTEGGEHTGPDGSRQALSCRAAPKDGSLLFFGVFPKTAECWLDVELLGAGTAENPCSGARLDGKRIVVTAQSESAGTGGAAGTSTSTATGAAGSGAGDTTASATTMEGGGGTGGTGGTGTTTATTGGAGAAGGSGGAAGAGGG